MIITLQNWPEVSKALATDNDPYLHSPAAMETFFTLFADHIYKVKAPHGKYCSINNCELIDFPTPEAAARYAKIEQKYLEDCAKLQKEPAQGRFQELVLLNKYRLGADFEKAPVFAKRMHEEVETNGKAAIAAVCFRSTIARTVRTLVKDYGVKRDEISLIWGGDDKFNKAKRLSQQEMITWVNKMVLGQKVPRHILKQIQTQLVETEEERSECEYDYGVDLDLGNQSRDERQRQIDRFQSGKSKYMLFTFTSGGVGIDIFHSGEDSLGNPVEQRPRRSFLTPTYSAQDFVQGLGRSHAQVFSLSDTKQTILFFRGTIEESVMVRVSIKLRCLGKTVATRESWMDAAWQAGSNKTEFDRRNMDEAKAIKDMVAEEQIDLNTESEDEDDENEDNE